LVFIKIWALILKCTIPSFCQCFVALVLRQSHLSHVIFRIEKITLSPDHMYEIYCCQVRIVEGGDGWVTFGGMRHFADGNWGVKDSPKHDETNYCVLAIYYPSLTRAIQWFDR